MPSIHGALTPVWQLAALHIHLRPHGPTLDYLGVFIASIVSWAGLPGPGEAALIAAAISAAHHHLDLSSLIVVAFIGATVGGIAGWFVGLKAGRAVATARGPLQRHRVAVVARGDRFFARFGAVAVLFTPSWMAGIHNMRWTRYLPVNAGSALVWALAIGVGAYEAGPSVADIATDVGSAAWAILAGVAIGAAAIAAMRHRRRQSR
ncbi:MAG: DedA family protein [Solirubrobacteraceae bacterium]